MNIEQEHYCGNIDVYVDDVRQHLSADVLRLPQGSGLQAMYIFNVGGSVNAARIHNLETAVEALSSYAFEGDKDKLQNSRNWVVSLLVLQIKPRASINRNKI